MDNQESYSWKTGVAVSSDQNLGAPSSPNSAAATIQITSSDDQAGVELVIPKIPDSYFNGSDSITAFMGAGKRPDVTDRKINVEGDSGGNFTVQKGAKSTKVTCKPGAFTEFVKELQLGNGLFYIRYAFGSSSGHVSEPASAKFTSTTA